MKERDHEIFKMSMSDGASGEDKLDERLRRRSRRGAAVKNPGSGLRRCPSLERRARARARCTSIYVPIRVV